METPRWSDVSDDQILVAGANGRLGSTVLRKLGTRGLAGVRRPRPGSHDVRIDSKGQIDPSQLEGVRAIINCAGVIAGPSDVIEQGNVTFPVNLATSARRHGVAVFVQVSSFSVYGRVERIDRETLIAPDSDYGHSKLCAEQQLHALMAPGFSVSALRVPFIFSAEHPSLLGSLVESISRLRMLPTAAGRPSRRSVITYDTAADLLIELAEASDPATSLCAADPADLDLVALARRLRTQLERRIAIVALPLVAVNAIEGLAPRLGNRLFRSSILDPAINIATERGDRAAEREISRYLEMLRRPTAEGSGSPRA